jgi:hypothetical protein
MPRWLSRVLRRIRRDAVAQRVSLTVKAQHELAALRLTPDDAHDALANVTFGDFSRRLESVSNGETMYLFRPWVAGMRLYLKVILREKCVVISFHEDEVGDEEDEA